MDWMYAFFIFCASIVVMFMVLTSRIPEVHSRIPEVSINYHLVHSDTAYTNTSTRGDGMTIINYYDKEKK